MNTRILTIGVACVALLSVAACNRDAATTDETSMAADDAAVDAVAVSDDGPAAVASGSSRSPGGASGVSASAGGTGATMTTGDARTTVSGETIPPASATQEQIAVTRETLSPAGASSGPTAPRPQN